MKTKKVKATTQRILNCIPSRETENDWKISNAIDANILTAGPIPLKKDLRENNWWKINDQGNTGSCVGWASADSVLRWHFVKKGLILENERLAIRFQWMAAKETDEFKDRASTFIESAGTSLKAALDISKKYGAVLENILPFNGELTQLEEATFYSMAAQRRISSYYNLINSGNTLQNFRNWIANNGPILTRLGIDSSWDGVQSDGILDNYQPNTIRGGHAVAIVGYTEDYFIVRNSWGTSWADDGYAYATNDYAMDAFTEGYGIIV